MVSHGFRCQQCEPLQCHLWWCLCISRSAKVSTALPEGMAFHMRSSSVFSGRFTCKLAWLLLWQGWWKPIPRKFIIKMSFSSRIFWHLRGFMSNINHQRIIVKVDYLHFVLSNEWFIFGKCPFTLGFSPYLGTFLFDVFPHPAKFFSDSHTWPHPIGYCLLTGFQSITRALWKK